MKRNLLIVLCIAATLVLFSGCAPNFCDPRIQHVQEHSVLPFIDGVFILTPSDFDEDSRASIFLNEGLDEQYRARSSPVIYYRAEIPYSRAEEFLDIMNSFSPVLVSSVISEWRDDEPFEGLTFWNSLYSLQLLIPNQMFTLELEGYPEITFAMYVYETDECGLLHFGLLGRIPHAWSDLGYYSLYRITLDELGELIQFVESLEIRYGLVHVTYRHPLDIFISSIADRFNIPPLAALIGIIVCVVILLIAIPIIIHRARKKIAKRSTQEETDD